MAYKGRLVEVSKKLGIKSIKIREKNKGCICLWDNKEGNTQGMCIFWGKVSTVLLALINWINKILQRGEYHRN